MELAKTFHLKSLGSATALNAIRASATVSTDFTSSTPLRMLP